jgi:hypothetical protein
MCIDRPIPFYLDDEARKIAIAENPENAEEPQDPTSEAGKLALLRRSKWRPGRTLRIRFLDGTPFLRRKVQELASEWTKHANLSFQFGDDPEAEIRVSFASDPGSSWSALGTDCLVERYFPRHQPTMSFGWLDDTTDEAELSRVIIHEFGHAIGCIHEHQNPKGGIRWNEQAVLAYFAGPPNYWDEDAIRTNVLDKYSLRTLNATELDPDSIMLYEFPASLTTTHQGTHSNTKLSPKDIELIREMYPGR